jgi:hypothetical protein
MPGDGRMDMTDLIDTFCGYANALKDQYIYCTLCNALYVIVTELETSERNLIPPPPWNSENILLQFFVIPTLKIYKQISSKRR